MICVFWKKHTPLEISTSSPVKIGIVETKSTKSLVAQFFLHYTFIHMCKHTYKHRQEIFQMLVYSPNPRNNPHWGESQNMGIWETSLDLSHKWHEYNHFIYSCCQSQGWSQELNPGTPTWDVGNIQLLGPTFSNLPTSLAWVFRSERKCFYFLVPALTW